MCQRSKTLTHMIQANDSFKSPEPTPPPFLFLTFDARLSVCVDISPMGEPLGATSYRVYENQSINTVLGHAALTQVGLAYFIHKKTIQISQRNWLRNRWTLVSRLQSELWVLGRLAKSTDTFAPAKGSTKLLSAKKTVYKISDLEPEHLHNDDFCTCTTTAAVVFGFKDMI